MSKQTHIPSKNDFWFLPLGGCGEIGMNLSLYGHDKSWLMVDLGITFHDRLGVEILMANPEFIAEKYKNLAGLVLTHAHEDHIGAVPYLWPAFRCPIYGTRFTLAILRQKLAEVSWGNRVKLIEISDSKEHTIGPFTVEFVGLTHSIPEPSALAISTPLGRVVHTGDWKLDEAPLIGEITDHSRLKALGDEGVLALFCDSTNVLMPGVSGSESDVHFALEKMIQRYSDRRVIVACFASNVARLQTIVKTAVDNGRKVALLGRSFRKMVEAALSCGYLKDLPPFIDEDEAMSLPRGDVLILATGSQGEPRSALPRIAAGTHPSIKLSSGDVVIFSSRIIPGNEKAIAAVHNRLVSQGLQIVTAYEEGDIHVSGHPAQDELKQMYEWIRPEILVPIHGELRHLEAQATLGRACGIKQTIVCENGHLIQLVGPKRGQIDVIQTGRLAYDGNRLVPFESQNLRDRQRLSYQGVVVATLVLDASNHFTRPMQISHWGITADEEETTALDNHIHRVVLAALGAGFSGKDMSETLRSLIRKAVSDRFDKKPLVDVHLVKV